MKGAKKNTDSARHKDDKEKHDELPNWDSLPDLSDFKVPSFAEVDVNSIPTNLGDIGTNSEWHLDSVSNSLSLGSDLDPTVGTSPESVARWMQEQIDAGQNVYQQSVAFQLASNFGDKFVYYNKNGNPAIKKGVLEAFRRINEETVVWHPRERYWRQRQINDPPGRKLKSK